MSTRSHARDARSRRPARTGLARGLLLSLLALCACDPTELVLVASSDLPSTQLGSVLVTTSSSAAGAAPQTRCACVAESCGANVAAAPLPLTAGLRPGRNASAPFAVALDGYSSTDCGGASFVQQHARARFTAHRRLLLRMSLDAACVGVTCIDTSTTCRGGSCVPIDFPVEDIGGGNPSIGDAPDAATAPAPDAAAPVDLATNPDDLSVAPSGIFGPVQMVASGNFGEVGLPGIARNGDYQIAVSLGAARILETRQVLLDDTLGLLQQGITVAGVVYEQAIPIVADPASSGFFIDALQSGADALVLSPAIGQHSILWTIDATVTLASTTLFALGNDLVIYRSFNDMSSPASWTPYPGPGYLVNTTPRPIQPGTGVVTPASASTPDRSHAVVWTTDATAHLTSWRDLDDLPVPSTEPAPVLRMAAASDASTHYVAMIGMSGGLIKWGRVSAIDKLGTLTLSTLPFNAVASSVAAGVDAGQLIIAYTDSVGLHEAVVDPATGAVTLPRLLHPVGATTTIDGLAFAPGPMPGGGRYVWRERPAQGPGESIYTARRDAALP